MENSLGKWIIREFDSDGNMIRHEDSNDNCHVFKYDSDGYIIHYDNSDGEQYHADAVIQ